MMSRLALPLLLLLAMSGLLLAAIDAFQMPSPVAEAKGVRSDVKHVACEACEALARHASSHVSQLREEKKKKEEVKEGDESPPSSASSSRFKRAPLAKGTLTEAEILDAVESMADPDSDAGEWLSHFDLEIVDKRLKLKDVGERGKCGSRCRTVAMAAADCLAGADTDLAERLWRGGAEAGPEEVARWLCREATSACVDPPPPLPAARAAALERELLAEPFSPESADDAQLRQMMASMKQQGMGGQMFDRQSVLKSLKEDDDDDDGDDDEEETEEKAKDAAAEENVKATLAEVMAAEEAKNKREKSREGGETPPSPYPSAAASSSSSDFSERAERAKAAAKEGIAAAKGWLSAKRASLFAASSSSESKSSSSKASTAEL